MDNENEWRGFLVESKSYMSYKTSTWKEKYMFWLRFPKAFTIFHWNTFKDYLKKGV